MTSLAHQSTAELGGRLSVLARQKADHVRLDRLLRRLEQAEGREEDEVLHRIARLVFPHAFAEESVLWPVLRRELPGGEELTLQVEQEHQEVNELWTRLEDAPAGSPERRRLVARLVEVLREDVRDEEDELFPRLQERVDAAALRRLGITWRPCDGWHRRGPTRSWPGDHRATPSPRPR